MNNQEYNLEHANHHLGLEEERATFRKLLFELLLLVCGSLVLSALITPALFIWLQSVWPELPWPYSRVYDRVIMGVAVALFLLRRRHFHIEKYRDDFHLHVRGQKASPIILGFFTTFFLSLCVVPLLVSGGTLEWSDNSWGTVFQRLLKVIPAALLISFIEEVFFRFFLFRSLRQYLSFWWSAGLSSALYSIVHFIQPVKSWGFTELEFSTGFSYLGLLVGRVMEPGFLGASFGLFLVGVVLCSTLERTRSLLPVIGLHAGWVATVKIVGKLCDPALGFEYPSGAGRRYYLLTEEFSWLAIVLVWIVTYCVFRNRSDGDCVQSDKEGGQ